MPKHQYHKCDKDTCQICEGGLALCDVCGGSEITLTTDCCGHRLSDFAYNSIAHGLYDFTEERGWHCKFTMIPLHSKFIMISLHNNEIGRPIRPENTIPPPPEPPKNIHQSELEPMSGIINHKNSVQVTTPVPILKEEIDPAGLKASEPGAKLDAGKLDPSLLEDFGLALQEVAVVSTLGAKKYSRGGWQSVDNGVERYKAAMWRHILKSRYHQYDETVLQGHKVMHLAQVIWNAMAALELTLRNNPDIAIAPKMGGISYDI